MSSWSATATHSSSATRGEPSACVASIVRRSRFSYLRRSDDGALLESPLSRHRVVLHEASAAALVGALGLRARARAAAAAVPDLGLDAALAVIDLLLAGNVASLGAEGD